MADFGTLANKAARELVAEIGRLAAEQPALRIMHVCGSHEHSLTRYGLRSLLPANVELLAGPGCPVCVCPESDIRAAIDLAEQGAVVMTYGDMLRVPTRSGSLADAAAKGADVRLVYSVVDAVTAARAEPERDVVFFAVGFETTAAPTAAILQSDLPANFSVLCSHRLTPPAMVELLRSGEIAVDALIAPGHVSVIVGAEAWRALSDEFSLPIVVAGFEPHDVLAAVRDILVQRRAGSAALANGYRRAVTPEGNLVARRLLDRAFEVASVPWRGLGELPGTGLALRPELATFDARERYAVPPPADDGMPPGCACAAVMLGQITPPECELFGTACTPESPHGPCMVSQEGTCFIWRQFGVAPAEALS